jgi:GNAT superfamily N-acetyltransferase
MEIRIRTAGVEDLADLIHQRRAMFEEMGHTDAGVLDRVDVVSREYFSAAWSAEKYRGWLAEELSGEIIGGGGIVIADWPGYPGEKRAARAWILNVYTEPAVRRRGVAKKLVEVMIEWCRSNGFGAVSLHASPAGRPLYEAIGFQQTNEMALKLR